MAKTPPPPAAARIHTSGTIRAGSYTSIDPFHDIVHNENCATFLGMIFAVLSRGRRIAYGTLSKSSSFYGTTPAGTVGILDATRG